MLICGTIIISLYAEWLCWHYWHGCHEYECQYSQQMKDFPGVQYIYRCSWWTVHSHAPRHLRTKQLSLYFSGDSNAYSSRQPCYLQVDVLFKELSSSLRLRKNALHLPRLQAPPSNTLEDAELEDLSMLEIQSAQTSVWPLQMVPTMRVSTYGRDCVLRGWNNRDAITLPGGRTGRLYQLYALCRDILSLPGVQWSLVSCCIFCLIFSCSQLLSPREYSGDAGRVEAISLSLWLGHGGGH